MVHLSPEIWQCTCRGNSLPAFIFCRFRCYMYPFQIVSNWKRIIRLKHQERDVPFLSFPFCKQARDVHVLYMYICKYILRIQLMRITLEEIAARASCISRKKHSSLHLMHCRAAACGHTPAMYVWESMSGNTRWLRVPEAAALNFAKSLLALKLLAHMFCDRSAIHPSKLLTLRSVYTQTLLKQLALNGTVKKVKTEQTIRSFSAKFFSSLTPTIHAHILYVYMYM